MMKGKHLVSLLLMDRPFLTASIASYYSIVYASFLSSEFCKPFLCTSGLYSKPRVTDTTVSAPLANDRPIVLLHTLRTSTYLCACVLYSTVARPQGSCDSNFRMHHTRHQSIVSMPKVLLMCFRCVCLLISRFI